MPTSPEASFSLRPGLSPSFHESRAAGGLTSSFLHAKDLVPISILTIIRSLLNSDIKTSLLNDQIFFLRVDSLNIMNIKDCNS